MPGALDLRRDERYTEQKRIDNGGGVANRELYHYGARFYLPGVGLFSQPDTVVPDPKNPQALNRYAYVYNSPVAYRDPSGNNPIPDGEIGNADEFFPSNLPVELRDAYTRLYFAGYEGRCLAEYLRRVNPYVAIRNGGGSYAFTLAGRWIGIDRSGSLNFTTSNLAHETAHLMQNDEAGNPAVSQEEEILAYQAQGRVLSELDAIYGGTDHTTFVWSRDNYQNLDPRSEAGRTALSSFWWGYANWPVSRPQSGLLTIPSHTVRMGWTALVGPSVDSAKRSIDSTCHALQANYAKWQAAGGGWPY